MKISVVIPVYHNQGSISLTHSRISDLFTRDLSEYDHEIIFVDDGSKDGSLSEILAVKDGDSHVRAISFTRNFGQMAAVLAGLREAAGDATIIISADLQDPIELIPKMINQWRDGAETVICYRSDRQDSFFSKLFSSLAYGILRITIPQIPRGGFDFVMMDQKVLSSFLAIDVRHRFFQGDLLWTGYRVSFIPYTRQARMIGK